MRNKILAGVAAVAVLTGGGVALANLANNDTAKKPVAVAQGQKAGDQASTQTRDDRAGTTKRGPKDGKGVNKRGSSVQVLAQELGVKEDDLSKALNNVRDELRKDPKHRSLDREARHAQLAEKLAAELKIDKDKVTKALDALRNQPRVKPSNQPRAEVSEQAKDRTQDGTGDRARERVRNKAGDKATDQPRGKAGAGAPGGRGGDR